MRPLLGSLLILVILAAQSAWAFEAPGGHAQEPAGSHGPTGGLGDDAGTPAGDAHCPHSPIHFLALHRQAATPTARPATSDLPPYRGHLAALTLEPPTQPPRG